jgi:predicted transcriptional regulator
MLAKELISEVVPALRTSDTGLKALSYMDIFRVSHLPIISNSEFLGLISDKDIYDLNMAEESLGAHTLSLMRPHVLLTQHIYDVIEVASRENISVIPVLDDKNTYMGAITQHDLLKYFATLTSARQPGGIIVLELNVNDYALSQIAQIVESNDAKILSLYLSPVNETTKLDVTLKLNRTDLSSIIQTFNRYNYIIKASFANSESLEDLYEDRFDMLMRYLNT